MNLLYIWKMITLKQTKNKHLNHKHLQIKIGIIIKITQKNLLSIIQKFLTNMKKLLLQWNSGGCNTIESVAKIFFNHCKRR